MVILICQVNQEKLVQILSLFLTSSPNPLYLFKWVTKVFSFDSNINGIRYLKLFSYMALFKNVQGAGRENKDGMHSNKEGK